MVRCDGVVGLVWYTVELIDYGLWIVIVWIVCVPGVLLIFFVVLLWRGRGDMCFIVCTILF